MWLEKEIKILYPNIEIDCNKIHPVCDFELDFFFPKLQCAIEVNGFLHSNPIYGKDKFEKLLARDRNKIEKCSNLNIKLLVVDSSGQKRFTEQSSLKYLQQIVEFINKKSE